MDKKYYFSFSNTCLFIIAKLILFLTLSAKAQAQEYTLPSLVMPLNKVTFQISTEKWIVSSTAKVIITVNATMSEEKLASVYQSIQQKLRTLTHNVPWRITAFQRNQDKSGLEQIYVTAESRLSEEQLNNLRRQLKSISVAGETYTLLSIDYTPTQEERQIALTALRNNIYHQIKNELTQLNATFPTQKYVTHTVDFMEEQPAPLQGLLMATATNNKENTDTNSKFVVSNEIQLKVNVVFASQLTNP